MKFIHIRLTLQGVCELPNFTGAEPHQRAMAHVHGLLSPPERKSSWRLAEISGAAIPYRLQNLLGHVCWGAGAVRDALCAHIIGHFGEWYAVLVISETEPSRKGAPFDCQPIAECRPVLHCLRGVKAYG